MFGEKVGNISRHLAYYIKRPSLGDDNVFSPYEFLDEILVMQMKAIQQLFQMVLFVE